jgi:hypothetical protein
MVVLYHIGGLEILVIDGVISTYQRQRRLMVEVLALAAHFLMRSC